MFSVFETTPDLGDTLRNRSIYVKKNTFLVDFVCTKQKSGGLFMRVWRFQI